LKAKQNDGDDDQKGGDTVNAKEVLGRFEQHLIRLSDGYVYDSADLGVIWLAEDQVTNAHKSPPKGKPKDRSQYADPDHYKYPIDDKHIRAAVAYYNQSGQKEAGGYSDEQWAAIGRRIAAAANKLIGPGYRYEDGKIVTPNSDGKGKKAEMDDDTNPNDGVTDPHDTDDVNAGKFSDKNKRKGGVQMSEQHNVAISLAEWQAAQERIRMLEQENRRAKLTEKVRGWMFDENTRTGKIAPAQQDKVVDLLMTMTDEQIAKFEEFIKGLPSAIDFSERGTSAWMPSGQADKSDQVVKLAEKYQREERMTWRDAFIRASEELGVN
jgi:hypothetical protein